MRKSLALMMLMLSSFALGENRSASATQNVVSQNEMMAPGAVAVTAMERRAELRAQRQAGQYYAQAHGALLKTLALYVQGLTTEERLMQAEEALADAERTCAAQGDSRRSRDRLFDAARYLL